MSIAINLPAAWGDAFKAPGPAKVPAPQLRAFEACGEWLENSLLAAMMKKSGSPGGSPTTKGASKDLPVASPTGPRMDRSKKKSGGAKLSDEEFGEDWYEILQIDEDEANEEVIRMAFRRRSLETHPDKVADHSDTLFKKVARAFDILSDVDLRCAYDSSRPFDDSIPGENLPADRFYKEFNECFERNKKFSMVDNLPSLGDENTPYPEVKKFYDAWLRFRSWRDFSHEVELEKINEDMQRDEKRFYQRENQRLLDKCVKDEMKRVRQLVDNAYNADPRLLKKRAEEEAAAQALRDERENARKKLREEEENRRFEKAERERKEAEEAKNKAKRAKEGIAELRKSFNNFLKEAGLLEAIPTNMTFPDKIRTPNITWLTTTGRRTPDQMAALLDEMQSKSTEPNSSSDGKGVEVVEVFNNFLTRTEQELGLNRYGESIKKVVHVDPVKEVKKDPSKTEWSDDDLLLLSKAIAKFPGGTVDRWARIGSMLTPAQPNKFTEEEILYKTKQMENGELVEFMKKQKAPVLGGGSSAGASTVDEDAAMAAAMETRPRLIRMLTKYSPDKLVNVNKILETYKGKEDELFKQLTKKFGAEPSLNDPALKKSGGAASAEGVEDWTANQQKQLEAGLRELKDYKEKDKYVKIAAKVDGKTAKQCFDRYKYLASIHK